MRAQRGFTLTEMMIVVAIIGVCVGIATLYVRPQAKTVDVANRVGDQMHETSREAVALGPVRADVVNALLAAGNPAQVARARTRLSASGASGGVITFTIEKMVEASLPSATGSWVPVQSYTTETTVAGISWAPGIGSNATLASALSTSWTALHIYCDPDGTCAPTTLFFQNLKDGAKSANYQARLSVMPLGSAIYTRADWN